MNRSSRLAFALATVGAAFALPASAATPNYVIKPIPYSAVHHGVKAFPRLRVQESTSGNWSGYAVPLDTSNTSDTFSLVQGAWVVPVVTGKSSATYSSTWVGLDGYNDGSVEQTGTEQDWTGKAQSNYVWFEMYPNPAYEITGFPVNPGDLMWAQVKYVATTTTATSFARPGVTSQVFQITIENLTQNVSFVIPASYTTVPSAARSSAEWVLEAPYYEEILPLADFTTDAFVECEATGTGTYSTSKGKKGVLEPINFWSADPLTMVDPEGGRSTPTALVGGSAFALTWSAK